VRIATRRSSRPLAAGLLLAALAVVAAPGPARAADPPPADQDCLACHADQGLTREKPARGQAASVFVDAAVLEGSTHAGVGCVDCHRGATAPHERLAPVVCAACHAEARAAVGQGAHGPGRSRPAGVACAACHGAHDVRPAAAMEPDRCAACHRSEVRGYAGGVHGQSRRRGGGEAATCRSCHGAAHTALTRADPRAPTYHLNLPRTCARCHGDAELARRYNIQAGNVYQLYMDSIHGRAVTRSGLLVAANCSDCHGAHDILPRTDPASRVSRPRVPETCGTCHAGVLREYRGSAHGTAAAGGHPIAPVCVDCHTAHQIRRVEAEAWKLDIVKECGTCHAESLRTYRDTFHGKVTALGFTRVARCSDCHGSHGVLPARDPASTVNPANRVKTCARCHPAANENFARYEPHADPDDPSRNRVLFATVTFMRALLFGTFSFFGIHTGLWLVRGLLRGGGGRRPGAGGPGESQETPGD
jgi:nitrate/TMAO reductase-like tetraheme cytochrome c subunit